MPELDVVNMPVVSDGVSFLPSKKLLNRQEYLPPFRNKFAQVSSVQPITKIITVILRRCNRTDRRYRPCSPVGGTEPTVNIDRD